MTYICDALQFRLPAGLRARMQERVYIELPEGMRHEYYPDVRIFEDPGRRRGGGGGAVEESGGVAVAEPFFIDLDIEPRTESYIEVIDLSSGRRVITSIEVISPTNKRPGDGRQLYIQKRQDMMRAGVNTVEIDLLRGGETLLPVSPERVPATYKTGYLIWIWRGAESEKRAVYRVPLRARLSVIPIPLRPTDTEVTVDLQAILDQCYRNGGYDDIDYREPASPPLDPDDTAWAEALLSERHLG